MNKWKLTFIFLTGFMLREFIGHVWLSADGVLPFTSRLFGFTISTETNTVFIIINGFVFLICGYLGFFYEWDGRVTQKRHA